jgi:uncharacterized protein (DUF1800 family)
MDAALRALNRFGLGARPGERGRIGNPRDWLTAQLHGGAPRLSVEPVSSAEVLATLQQVQRAGGSGTQEERAQARQRLARIASQEQRAVLTERLRSERPFVERLVAFWSNHLCVSGQGKPLVLALAGSYERDVIRTHVMGRFEDMVLASARHPAMLLYLDNYLSIGPSSPGVRMGAQRPAARRGLNENYARELLELHTLGVDGGYTQQDVIELAMALTGWTLSGVPGPGMAAQLAGGGAQRPMQRRQQQADAPVAFLFADIVHEPGERSLLGHRYPQRGSAQAETMIRDLCRRPATARFAATKLVTHFVADAPPASAVDRIAAVFERSGGDLRAVSEALVGLPEAWSDSARKFRAPQDWLTAALRALDMPVANDTISPLLRQLRQPLWGPPAPKGYGDTAQEWADPDSLLNRAELARTLARRPATRRLDPRQLADVIDVPASDAAHALLADTSIPADERVALLLAGPAFQWR